MYSINQLHAPPLPRARAHETVDRNRRAKIFPRTRLKII
jgi:hypothetical protein